MQITVCEVCGVLGYKNLLLSCKNCNRAAVHRYCLDKVDFDGTVDWSCDECHPRHGKVTNGRSLEVTLDDKTVVGKQPENHWAESSLDTNHNKPGTNGGNDDYVSDDLMLERNKERFQLHDKANNDLHQKSMSANVPQSSTLHESSVALTVSSSANTGLPMDSNCLATAHIDIGNPRDSSVRLVLTGENQRESSMLLDGACSGSLSKVSSKDKIVREASSSHMGPSDAVRNFCKDNPMKRRKLMLLDDDDDVGVELSDTVQNVVKDNPSKRRKLILPDDDDDDVEDNPGKPIQLIVLDDDDEQEDAENLNHLSLECEEPIEKHRIQIGYATGQRCLEDGEHDGVLDSLDRQSLENACHTKKRRRYICPSDDEEEEVIKGSTIAGCALNDVANTASQHVDAKGHHLQSRMTFASDFTKHQYYIYSQPMGEPAWSGIFMTDSNVPIMLDAHLSIKACQRVSEFARSLRPVIEVIKLPRLKAWPERWGKSGPTDDSIGLFFFPHSMRPNEELDTLVKKVIESDVVLKAVLGTVELLIFPSILLPEQYHEFQGKYYLWGVCRARKHNPDTAVLVEEQCGLVSASEEGSSDKESYVMKHVEDQLPADCNPEAQDGDIKNALGEGCVSSDSCLSSNKASPAKGGSPCFMQPGLGDKPREPGVADQQEDEQDFTSLPRWNDQNATNQPIDSLPSATRLFGFVTARSEKCQQLIQEMVREGAFLFSVPEEMTITGSTKSKSNAVVGAAQAPDNGYQHTQERRREPIEFVPIDHNDPNSASEACLDLFPVRHEQIGLTSQVDVNEVELDLSLGAFRRAPSELP
uniref:Zinc finger PHD-type domain-containing protein n=1 Tax=Oryza punctata TaxID=4537 RepID=A0A0E0MJX6_ORYPU